MSSLVVLLSSRMSTEERIWVDVFLLRALLSECPERGSKVKGLSLRVNAHSRLLESRERLRFARCCCWCNVSYNSTGFSFSFLSWEFSRLPVSISKALLILREAANICHFSRHFFVGLFVACFINCVVNYLNYIFQKDRSLLYVDYFWKPTFFEIQEKHTLC